MASILTPRIATFTAGGTVVKGHAVKLSSGNVVECTANTDHAIGIAQNGAASGEPVEVALPGGGAKAVASETIAAGNYLVAHTDGTMAKANAAGDHVIAMAMESAVVGDVFSVEVCHFLAAAAEA